jgi:2'-5' RNA ligase
VLAHYAVRWLLHEAASRHRLPHAELSFTDHVQLLRRAQPRSGPFPPRVGETTTAVSQ